MLSKSLTKIISASFQCSRRSFSSKGPRSPESEWWNKPVNELKPIHEILKEANVPPRAAGEVGPTSKVVSIANSSSSSSYSDYKETPCAEKKFSPCAAKKERPKSPNRPVKKSQSDNHYESKSTSDCSHHKSLVPPSCDLQQLKSYELKSTCTSFHLQTEN